MARSKITQEEDVQLDEVQWKVVCLDRLISTGASVIRGVKGSRRLGLVKLLGIWFTTSRNKQRRRA